MNYASLLASIQEYTQNSEAVFVAEIPNFVKQTEDRIQHLVQLPVFRKTSSVAMSASNKNFSTPSDFVSVNSFAVLDGSSNYTFMLNKDVNFIREAYPVSTTTGKPKYYALFDDSSFILGPTPDSGYGVELHYFYKPTSITTSGDGTSWLGDNAENALLYGCLLEGYTFMKGDADMMAIYEKRYEDALVRLKSLGEGYSTTDNYRSGAVRNQRF